MDTRIFLKKSGDSDFTTTGAEASGAQYTGKNQYW